MARAGTCFRTSFWRGFEVHCPNSMAYWPAIMTRGFWYTKWRITIIKSASTVWGDILLKGVAMNHKNKNLVCIYLWPWMSGLPWINNRWVSSWLCFKCIVDINMRSVCVGVSVCVPCDLRNGTFYCWEPFTSTKSSPGEFHEPGIVIFLKHTLHMQA